MIEWDIIFNFFNDATRDKLGLHEKMDRKKINENELWTMVVVVKWSACLPSTATIRVRIQPMSTFCSLYLKRTKVMTMTED